MLVWPPLMACGGIRWRVVACGGVWWRVVVTCSGIESNLISQTFQQWCFVGQSSVLEVWFGCR